MTATTTRRFKHRWVVATTQHHVVLPDSTTYRSYPTRSDACAACESAAKKRGAFFRSNYIFDAHNAEHLKRYVG